MLVGEEQLVRFSDWLDYSIGAARFPNRTERNAHRFIAYSLEHLNVEPKRENKAYIAFIIPSETELISRETEEPFMDFIVELQDREEDVIGPRISLSWTRK